MSLIRPRRKGKPYVRTTYHLIRAFIKTRSETGHISATTNKIERDFGSN